MKDAAVAGPNGRITRMTRHRSAKKAFWCALIPLEARLPHYTLYAETTHSLLGTIDADDDAQAILAVQMRLDRVNVELWRGGEKIALVPAAGKYLRKVH